MTVAIYVIYLTLFSLLNSQNYVDLYNNLHLVYNDEHML